MCLVCIYILSIISDIHGIDTPNFWGPYNGKVAVAKEQTRKDDEDVSQATEYMCLSSCRGVCNWCSFCRGLAGDAIIQR